MQPFQAAAAVGVHYTTPYKRKQVDPDFADAMEVGTQVIEAQAFKLAVEGNNL